MINTQYLPAEWLDEVVPAPVDKPDELLSIVDGRFYLIARDHEGEPDEDWKTEIQDGTFVEFCEFRDHGHWTISVRGADDGSYIISGGEGIPAEANCFVADGDTDTFAESLEDMIAGIAHFDPNHADTFSVHAYHWSDGKPWYFAVVDECAVFSPPGTFGSEAIH